MCPLEPEATQIEARIERQAERQRRRPAIDLLVSGFVGGLDVGFAPLGLAFVAARAVDTVGVETALLLGALAYSIGFVFVILGRSQLFTESTLVPVVGVLSGVSTIRRLARQWSLVLTANLAGAFVVALLITNPWGASVNVQPQRNAHAFSTAPCCSET